MSIVSIQEAINKQIEINKFLKCCNMKDLVGDYGELIIQVALGGQRENSVNKGYDILHKTYGRIEVKTRQLKTETSNETRAVGFKNKEGLFDMLAHIILDHEFNVINACLVKYEDVWPEIKDKNKISFESSSALPSSENILAKVQLTQKKLNVLSVSIKN